jgi:CheY-like chemotaxis protein
MKRVLFVDDEPHVLESVRDVLRPCRREWQMGVVTDGASALEQLAEAACDAGAPARDRRGAFHHRPAEVHDPIFDASAAVAIADGLLNELADAGCCGDRQTCTPLDPDYLAALGVADQLPRWRELARAISG